MLQIDKSKQSTNAYNRETRRWNLKMQILKHLSPSPDIVLTIQPDNFKYHVSRTYYPKISPIQRWTNPQLQSKKCFLVGVWKSQWFFLSLLSQCFVTVFPLHMSFSLLIHLIPPSSFILFIPLIFSMRGIRWFILSSSLYTFNPRT